MVIFFGRCSDCRISICKINVFQINQCFILSVDIKVILDNNQKLKKQIYYTNLPTGLCTINLTTKIIILVLYRMSLTLLQSLKSYPFFWNKSVVIGHSSSMCLTDRIFLQICKPPRSTHTTLRASHPEQTKKRNKKVRCTQNGVRIPPVGNNNKNNNGNL